MPATSASVSPSLAAYVVVPVCRKPRSVTSTTGTDSDVPAARVPPKSTSPLVAEMAFANQLRLAWSSIPPSARTRRYAAIRAIVSSSATS
jgi:hypothetical protein